MNKQDSSEVFYKLEAESLAVALEIRLAAYDASMSLLELLLDVSENDTTPNSPVVAQIRLRFRALRGSMECLDLKPASENGVGGSCFPHNPL